MIKIGNRHILFILLLTVFNATLWADISLKTSVDKKQVAINDTLTLKFEISGNRDLPNANLPQINDFQILGTSRISRISILNGQVNKVLESNYTLAPKRMGQITIPSFAFNYEGKKYPPTLFPSLLWQREVNRRLREGRPTRMSKVLPIFS